MSEIIPRVICSQCVHAWRKPVEFYELTDYVLHGCKCPSNRKFADRPESFKNCKKYKQERDE